MKSLLRITAVAAALSFAGAASAQQQHNVRFGLGVGLPTSELTSLFASSSAGGTTGFLPAQIYVPIDLTPSFRLEPQIGIVTSKQDGGTSGSYYAVGAGAFYLMPLVQQAHLYVGGRLVIGWERTTTPAGGGFTTETKGTDLYLAGAFGGEVMPHPRLGIGAEAQLGRWGYGDRTATTAGVSTTVSGGSSWQTMGVIFVRLYFS